MRAARATGGCSRIDEQSGAYLDDPQLPTSTRRPSRLEPGDRVILAAPAPTWVKAVDHPTAYDSIDYFIRTIIAPTGAEVRLLVSGDLHHYARYAGAGPAADHLRRRRRLPLPRPTSCRSGSTVPPKDTLARKASLSRPYDAGGALPDAAALPAVRLGRLRAGCRSRNPGFATLLGILHTLLMLAMAGVAASRAGSTEQRLFSIPLVIMLVVTLLGAALLRQAAERRRQAARPALDPRRRPRRRPGRPGRRGHLGVAAAAVLRLAVAAAGGRRGGRLRPGRSAWWPASWCALYLLVASAFGVNVNELFAGQGIEDSKSFLRLHIDPRRHADHLPDRASTGSAATGGPTPTSARRPPPG